MHLRVVVGANPYRDIWAYTHESLLQRENNVRFANLASLPKANVGGSLAVDEVLQTFPAAHKGICKISFNMVGAGAHDSP